VTDGGDDLERYEQGAHERAHRRARDLQEDHAEHVRQLADRRAKTPDPRAP
jgi:hypothetical protein